MPLPQNKLRMTNCIILLLSLIATIDGLAFDVHKFRHDVRLQTMEYFRNNLTKRRELLRTAASVITLLLTIREPVGGNAATTPSQSSIKPYAPIETLVPAVRVKRLIDRCVFLALERQTINDETTKTILFDELNDLLLNPPKIMKGQDANSLNIKQPGRQYMDSYQQKRRDIPWLAQAGAFLVQNGEIMTWNSLQQRERGRESLNEFRAAFNLYQDSLQFDANKYVLTVAKEDRKQMIRQDRLPDVKSVIAADLDLRSLYRNFVLTKWDDARAELAYQRGQLSPEQNTTSLNLEELLDILLEAQRACETWFSFIDENDVKEAMDMIDG